MSSTLTKRGNASEVQPYQAMRGHTRYVQGVAHLRDGRHIITCSWDGSIRLWDRGSGAQVGEEWRDLQSRSIYCIALSPSGKTLASGSEDGTVRLWDIETRNVIAKWNSHTSWVYSVCWSADGEHVASGSHDGTVGIWNVKKGELVWGPTKTGHQEMRAVAYSPDMSSIATGGENEDAIKIWDAKTGELLSTLKQESAVRSLAWPDQKKTIAGLYDNSIRIFDTVTWDQIAILEGHTNVVATISLFDNNRLLASGSWDRTARLWNLDTNCPVGPPLHHQRWVNEVAFSADGKFLATVCDDNNAYVWDIHTILKGISNVPYLQVANTKSILNSDATRKPIAKLKNTHTIPHSFFGDPSTSHIDPPLAVVRPNCLSSTTGDESTSNTDTPASTSHPDPPPSIHHRYSVSHARALFRRYVLQFRGSQSNTVESTELQKQSTQHVNSVHEPANVQVPALLMSYSQVTDMRSILDSDATPHFHTLEDTHSLPQDFSDDASNDILVCFQLFWFQFTTPKQAQSSTPHTNLPPAAGHHPRSSAHTNFPESADTPAFSSHSDLPPMRRRYNINASRPHAFFRHYLPHFRRSQRFHDPNTDESTELQRRPEQGIVSEHQFAIVDVAEGRDNQPLYVAPPQPERPSEKAKCIENPTRLERFIFFILCVRRTKKPDGNINGTGL